MGEHSPPPGWAEVAASPPCQKKAAKLEGGRGLSLSRRYGAWEHGARTEVPLSQVTSLTTPVSAPGLPHAVMLYKCLPRPEARLPVHPSILVTQSSRHLLLPARLPTTIFDPARVNINYLNQPTTTTTNNYHNACSASLSTPSLPGTTTQPPAAASAQARLSMEASRLDKHNYAPSTKFIIGLSQLGPTAASRGSAHARQRTITTTTPPPNALESAPANTTTQTCPASCTRHRAGSDSESRRLLFSALRWHRISSNHQPARLRVWPCARQPTHSWPHGAA